ncbi:MAG: pilus assembly protein PilM [Candidatus Binatia bacterium]
MQVANSLREALYRKGTDPEMSFSSIVSRASASLRSAFSARRETGVVAIDFSPTAVRAIHVRRDGEELVLDGFRLIRLGGDGEGRSLEDAFRDALTLRLRSDSVVFSLTSPELAIRKLELPPMTPKELREALPWEARRHIADLPADAILDAQVLGRDPRATSDGPMEVVLVAFPRSLYEDVSGVLRRVGVEPVFIDVSQMSAMNGVLSGRIVGESGPLALLDLGSGLGSFSIFSSGNLILFRDLGQRVAHLDRLLGAALRLDGEQLETFKVSGKSPHGEAPSPAVVQRAIADVTAELAEDLRAGLLYLENRTGGSLDRVYLSGSAASFFGRYGIDDAISAQSGLALERFNPLRGFRIGLVDEIGLRTAAAELTAAAGLATRYFTS